MLNLKICNLLFIFSNCFAILFSRISTSPFPAFTSLNWNFFFLSLFLLSWNPLRYTMIIFMTLQLPSIIKKQRPRSLVWCEEMSENVIFMFAIKWFAIAMRNNRELSFVSEMDMHLWNCKMTGGKIEWAIKKMGSWNWQNCMTTLICNLRNSFCKQPVITIS